MKGTIRLACSEENELINTLHLRDPNEAWQAANEAVFFSESYAEVEDYPVFKLVMTLWEDSMMAQCASVEIVNNPNWEFDPAYVGPQDIYLDSSETGLPFPIIISTDVMTPVLLNQLSEPLATVPSNVCDIVNILAAGGTVDGLRVGLDWDEPGPKGFDREAWKETETHFALALGGSALDYIWHD